MQQNQDSQGYKISEIGDLLGLSADTLRYYEKIGLLPQVPRGESGIRCYGEQEIARIRFIQRAKTMRFSLAEITTLVKARADPKDACRQQVHELSLKKLAEIEGNLRDMTILRDELMQLTQLCGQAVQGCPILEDLDSNK